MERRGFLEKFAKTAVGVVLAPEEFIGDEGPSKRMRHHLPVVVKVTDETVLSGGKLNTEALTKMFFAGLKALYSDISEEDFIRTLFPGLVKGAKIGAAFYGNDNPSQYILQSLISLIESLNLFPHENDSLARDRIIAWSGNPPFPDSVSSAGSHELNFTFNRKDDHPLDEELDCFMEMDDFSIAPAPLLSRVCQFQIGFAAVQGSLQGKNICRDLFLNCFVRDDGQPLLPSFSGEDRTSLFETLEYPQGMKFRIVIVERLADDGALFICGDGVYLDRYLSGKLENLSNLIEIVEVVNPSAPLADNVSFKRRGSDNAVKWPDEDYPGLYQVYRCGSEKKYPEKCDLIGFTRNNEFTDVEAAELENIHYLVTLEWGVD